MAYKLYVSPAVEDLADTLPVLVEALTRAGAKRFKVGPDAPGLLRPDQIVVHTARQPGKRRANAKALRAVGISSRALVTSRR